MKASIKFSKLIKDCLKQLLNKAGFKGRGNTFILKKDDVWSLINFQKSRKSSITEVIFTVNLGIASSTLFDFYAKEVEQPKIEDCHYQQRIGFLLPQNHDKWWTINSETDMDGLCVELKKILSEYAFIELERYSSNSALRDLWLSDKCPGLTDTQRLMNLTVLLKKNGPKDIFKEVLEGMRLTTENKPTAPTIERHIQKLTKGDENA
jgi:hypothetical protein